MYPETHLLASWVIGAKTTDNARDCRLIALAGILPDVDGLGLIADMATQALGMKKTLFYEHYHHYLLHGAFGAFCHSAHVFCLTDKWRVALLALIVVHRHLLCDFVGSRDLNPKTFGRSSLGPFTKIRCGFGRDSYAWTAGPIGCCPPGLFLWALWLAVPRGYSFVGVFSKRLDINSSGFCAGGMIVSLFGGSERHRPRIDVG